MNSPNEKTLQRTPEWRDERAGKITASRFADVMAFTDPEPGAVYASAPAGPKASPFQGGGPCWHTPRRGSAVPCWIG